jgi:hypothetical protein
MNRRPVSRQGAPLGAWAQRAYRTGRGPAHQMWKRVGQTIPPRLSLLQGCRCSRRYPDTDSTPQASTICAVGFARNVRSGTLIGRSPPRTADWSISGYFPRGSAAHSNLAGRLDPELKERREHLGAYGRSRALALRPNSLVDCPMQKRAKLSHEEWRWIQRLIPGHEPALLQSARKGKSYYVAEPRLVGNARLSQRMHRYHGFGSVLYQA